MIGCSPNQRGTVNNAIWVLNVHGGHGGHHDEYYAVFERVFDARRHDLNLGAFLPRKPFLIPIVEASTVNYAVLFLVRSLLGRHTAGLLFRPLSTIHDT